MSIKRSVKNSIKRSGVYRVFSPVYSGAGSILMFHRICRKEDKSILGNNSVLEVTPEYLEQIIGYFRGRDYRFVPIGDVPGILRSGSHDRKKFVVFTFDDGYADNYLLAYPVFKKYNVPFTVYVTTSFPDGTAVLWWYLLEELIRKNEHIEFGFKGRSYAFECVSQAEKNKVFYIIKSVFMGSDENAGGEELRSLFAKYGINAGDRTKELALSWEMIKKMARDPIATIGAHTISHLALSRLGAPNLNKEVEGSKKRIEEMTGCKALHFSYPFGGKNEAGSREFDAVKGFGFETATTTRMSNVFKAHKDHLLSLPRLLVDGNNEDIRDLDMYVSGFIPFILNKGKRLVTD